MSRMRKWTPDEAHVEAVRRIRHARDRGAAVLDLGDLGLADLPPELATLTDLRVLSLGNYQVTETDQGVTWDFHGERPDGTIRDLSPLTDLKALTGLDLSWCKALSDVSPLEGLTALTTLRLRSTAVADVSPLEGLAALTTLDRSGCEALSDVSPLEGLAALTTLDPSGCRGICVSALAPLFDTLGELRLHEAECIDFPRELCGEDGENVLPAVVGYFRDLGDAPPADAEYKAYLIGNGRAGKTKLARRLRGLDYGEPHEVTTHGVRLYDLPFAVGGVPHPVRLNLWDFGGQDIYHGSHSLFLRGPAVFLLVWTPDTENEGTSQENGIPLRNRRLPYWFDYLREVAGVDRGGRRVVESPVLLIQSRCDTARLERPAPAELPCPDEFPNLFVLHVSAKTGHNLEDVTEDIGKAVRRLVRSRPRPPLGPGWVRVRDRLRAMQAVDPPARKRTLPRADFDAMCEAAGGVSAPAVLLRFLHESGVVFHRDSLFGDNVIVDQQWALDAIYTVFDRDRVARHFVGNGRFTESLLAALAWPDRPAEDRHTFLGMMVQCGIVFPARRLNPGEHPEEWEYVVPEWLPGFEARDVLHDKLQKPADAAAVARLRFLHDGIARTLLARVGAKAEDSAISWKFGFWFRSAGSEVLARVLPAPGASAAGSVEVLAWGSRAEWLVTAVLETLDTVTTGTKPTIERTGKAARPALEADADEPRIVTGRGVEALPAIGGPPPPGTPENGVFVSYAWGDATDDGRRREALVIEMVGALRAWKYDPFHDKERMKFGDSIPEYMLNAGTLPRVAAVLSEKYLRSVNCMSEMAECYLCSGLRDDVFQRRFKPMCLTDARFHTDDDRETWGQFWEGELNTAFDRLRARRALPFSPSRLDRMCQWVPHVPRMLHAVWAVLHPVGFEQIARDGFADLKAMLGK